ncbi:MAG: GGDEF domain-containing protein [Clostridia bacterium]|nr:GGDEF domain-containing protein [Clostridia bacterium]
MKSFTDLFKGTGIEDALLKKEFFSLILSCSLFTAIAFLVEALIFRKHLLCVAIYITMISFLSILVFAGKKDESAFMQKKRYISYSILMGCVLIPAVYLVGGGIYSGAPLFFMMAGVFVLLLLDNALMIGVFLFMMFSAGFVYILDYRTEGLVERFTDLGGKTYLDIGISTIIVGLSIGFFLRQLTKFFDENQDKANELLGRIENAATKDPLSGAYNRRYLMDYLEECIKQVENDKLHTFSLLMFDIDHFKNINDKYGHLAGDDCIKNLVLILKSSLRSVDVVTRYGGEEFICVLPTAEDTPAFRRAEQIRVAVENTQLSADIDKTITVSGGVFMYKPGMRPEELIKAVDHNLYIAKESGRNQIVWHDGGIPPLVYAAYSGDVLEPVQNSGRRFTDASATKF